MRPRWGVPWSLFYDMTSRIYDTPDKTVTQNSDALQDAANMYERTLKTDSLGRPFRFESLVASTNDMARDWALVGGPHGALFFADEQAQGRGRRGRVWQTQPGVNLTFSLILRSEFLSVDIGLITLAAGFAMFKTLRTLFPTLNIQIKWPNDILIGPRKCSGILLESSIGADRSDKFAILGIGLNVNQITFSGDLERTATSLLLETGHRQDRIGLLVAFLDELETRILQISGDKSSFLKEYEGHLAGIRKMLEEDRYCVDILKQTHAVRRAVEKMEASILEGHLKTHVVDGIRAGNDEQILGELMELYDMAAKNNIGGR